MNLRLAGKKLHKHSSKPPGVVAERGSHPFFPGCRGISLVEDQVDHREHRLHPPAQVVSARCLKGNMSFRESLLGAKDSLAYGLLRHKEGAGDLRRGEAADKTQRKRDASFHRKHRMARGK